MARNDSSGFGNPLARDRSQQAIRTAFRRKWTLIGTLILAFGAASGILIAHFARQNAERELTRAYLAAQSAYEDEIEAYQKELQGLDNLEKAKDLRPNHSKSTPLFREFSDKYRGHPLAWQADLRIAQEDMKDKNFDAAIARLEPMASKTRSFSIMQVKLRETLAGLYAEKGDFTRALAEMAIVEKIADNPAPDGTLLRKAQYTFLSGDKESAGRQLGELAKGRVGELMIGDDVSTEASNWLDLWDLKP